jgi:hypothetical protein
VREVHTPNDGRDPFPILITRHKLPKNRENVDSSFPAIVMEYTNNEIKEYFTAKDFMLGSTVQIYNRRVLIYDWDQFTMAFYHVHFGVTEVNPIDVRTKAEAMAKMVGFLFMSLFCLFKLMTDCATSNIDCATSNIDCATSNIACATSNIDCATSKIDCATSNIELRDFQY